MTAARRVAAIDIGTNSVRLIVAESGGEGGYHELGDEREQTRLGRQLDETGRIGGEAVARTLEALERMVETSEDFDVVRLRAIGTAALREADNGPEFVETVRQRLGLHIEVVSPEREAELAIRSVRRRFPQTAPPMTIVDIGGGSMEIVFTTEGAVDEVHSLPLGAVRLSERYVQSDPISPRDWTRLCAGIDEELAQHVGARSVDAPLLIGSGGTFTAIASLVMHERQSDVVPVQGFAMSPADIVRQLQRLREAPLPERRRFSGLEPERADIILAGTAAVARLVDRLGAKRILVNDHGIRDGLILEMLDSAARLSGR